MAEIDPASLPPVSIDPDVAGLSASLATPEGAQQLAATLAWNLQVEAEGLTTGDASLLTAVDHGQRLQDLQDEIAGGERVVPAYQFDSLHLEVVFPGGVQMGRTPDSRPRGRSPRSCTEPTAVRRPGRPDPSR